MNAPAPTETVDPVSTEHENEFAAQNSEKDSLHILPLSMIPLETATLRRARLLKDARLRAVVELFRDNEGGSARVDPARLNQYFNWPEKPMHPDIVTIRALQDLHSFDVFSLRIELRRLHIRVNDHSSLRLSEEKNQQLTQYMTEFTRPLMQQIYGKAESQIDEIGDLFKMFSNPNKEEAINNIKRMADKLDIQMQDVPVFLEDYGDVFLSLAYFKDQLDEIVPMILEFTSELQNLKENYQLRKDGNFIDNCEYIESSFTDITASITGRFEAFDRQSQNVWENITAESFQKMKNLITAHHTTVGGVLCGLKVKMMAWHDKFPGRQGGPVARSDFIMSEIKQGIDVIVKIENAAPKVGRH